MLIKWYKNYEFYAYTSRLFKASILIRIIFDPSPIPIPSIKTTQRKLNLPEKPVQ